MKNQLLKGIAQKDLIVANWRDSLEKAYGLICAAGVRHLPVVDENAHVVGILSDRDFQRAMQIDQPDFISGKAPRPEFDPSAMVRDYMSWPIEAIDEKSSVADAARRMIDAKISSLLVTRESYVVGIVTTEDLLRAFLSQHESALQEIPATLKAKLYDSPIGHIAQALANAGV